MNLQSFSNSMKTIVRYFKSDLKDYHIDRYFNKLKHIPENILTLILEDFMETRRPSPGNFPTIRELELAWQDWRNDHPRQAYNQDVKPEHCDICKGLGAVTLYRNVTDLGYWARVDVQCKCNNRFAYWGKFSPVMIFRDELLHDTEQWAIKDPMADEVRARVKSYVSLEEMADSFGGWPEEPPEELDIENLPF